MLDVFNHFAFLLNERLNSGAFTSEAAVRHTFFHALLNSPDYFHWEVIFESPYSKSSGAKIDILVKSSRGKKDLVIEFKYDRRNTKRTNPKPRTMQAASLFNDVFRLAFFESKSKAERYLIYLTDAEMIAYFRNPCNNFQDFFDLPENKVYSIRKDDFLDRLPAFKKKLKVDPIDCKLLSIISRDLDKNHSLRIYGVIP